MSDSMLTRMMHPQRSQAASRNHKEINMATAVLRKKEIQIPTIVTDGVDLHLSVDEARLISAILGLMRFNHVGELTEGARIFSQLNYGIFDAISNVVSFGADLPAPFNKVSKKTLDLFVDP
jgi:hypothetical protein